jgi:hypothetical protein
MASAAVAARTWIPRTSVADQVPPPSGWLIGRPAGPATDWPSPGQGVSIGCMPSQPAQRVSPRGRGHLIGTEDSPRSPAQGGHPKESAREDMNETLESTTPPTTIVTFEHGTVFHWQRSCHYFNQPSKKNRYTPCTTCARAKKFI